MSYRAVVFDLYGTLVDDLPREEYREVLSRMAEMFSLSADEFVEAWQQTGARRTVGDFTTVEECIAHVCHALGVEVDAERIEAAVELRVGFTRAHLIPRDDAVETLTRLKSTGLKIGLISDCGLEVPMLWSEMPFAPLIDAPIFSSREGLRKPDPQIYHRVCERLKVKAGECLYVGDGNSQELSGATVVGMKAVLIEVPGAVSYDYGQLEAGSWQGARIAALGEIVNLVD
jgi:putative hydrolase of the HAD superfamily